jgi:hypothetical protein
LQIAAIEGATRIIGKSQGYYGLPLRDDVRDLPDGHAFLIDLARSEARAQADHKLSASTAVATLLTALADALETLPVLDKVENYTVPGPGTPVMVTAWTPTPGELIALNAGSNIHVEILGIHHPPILLKVGPLPE